MANTRTPLTHAHDMQLAQHTAQRSARLRLRRGFRAMGARPPGWHTAALRAAHVPIAFEHGTLERARMERASAQKS